MKTCTQIKFHTLVTSKLHKYRSYEEIPFSSVLVVQLVTKTQH